MNDGRARNHYGRKPSNTAVCPAHGGRIEEAGALLRLGSSYAKRRSYLTGEEVCERLKLSARTLQEYRSSGLLAFYEIGDKILYKQSDLQAMLDRHYNPIQKPSV